MEAQPALTSDPQPELVPTNMGEVAVTREGPLTAPPLLCAHGIPGSSRDFRYLAPLLATDHHVVRLEMPGFGQSPPSRTQTLAGWAQVLSAVAEALGLDRYGLLGHSFGGGATILAAAGRPQRISSLVLISSMGGRIHRGYGLPPAAYRLFAAAFWAPGSRHLAHRFAHRQYRRLGLKAPADWRVLHHQVRVIGSVSFPALAQAAARVGAPARLFHARDDRLVQHQIARELATTLPHGRLVLFDSGGHHLQKSRAREIADELRS
jgi:pimeloyl-ACP methyl ester carboxylesterase